MIVRIKSYLQSNGVVDLDCVYNAWVQAKDRREKLECLHTIDTKR